MAGRVMWVGIAGLALATGMVLQDGPRLLDWIGDSGISRRAERSIDAKVDAAIDRSVARMDVIDADGREIEVDADTKRAFADAVGDFAKAETDLAMIKIRDGAADEMKAATARRDAARAEVDRLKTAMRAEDRSAAAEARADRQELRDEIRAEIRDAVRN